MGSKERRAREKALVHKLILDAAQELFTRHGYEAVTMRRIAEQVEYTPTALYFHFQNKEALLQELSDRAATAMAAEFGKLVNVQDPLERLRRMGEAYLQFALAHPNEYRLLFMTSHTALPPAHSNVSKEDHDAYALLVQTMAEAIAAGLLRPDLTDAEQAAQVLWSGMHGFVSLILARHDASSKDGRPEAPTGRLMIETLVAGLTGTARLAEPISPPQGADARISSSSGAEADSQRRISR